MNSNREIVHKRAEAVHDKEHTRRYTPLQKGHILFYFKTFPQNSLDECL